MLPRTRRTAVTTGGHGASGRRTTVTKLPRSMTDATPCTDISIFPMGCLAASSGVRKLTRSGHSTSPQTNFRA